MKKRIVELNEEQLINLRIMLDGVPVKLHRMMIMITKKEVEFKIIPLIKSKVKKDDGSS